MRNEQEHLWAYPFLATVVSVLGGCAPAKDFQPAKELADLDQAASTLEWREQRFPVGTFQGAPFHLAVRECGPDSAAAAFIFLPGILSDSRVWKLVCAGMSPETLRVCIDTLGCGHSDTPSASGPGQTLYESTEMARQVLEALRRWNEHRSTSSAPRWTLVAHSFSGEIAVRMLCDAGLRQRYGEVLENIHAVVLLAPFDPGTWIRQQKYERIITTTDFGWWLAGVTGGIRKMGQISPRGAVDSSRQLPRGPGHRRGNPVGPRAPTGVEGEADAGVPRLLRNTAGRPPTRLGSNPQPRSRVRAPDDPVSDRLGIRR